MTITKICTKCLIPKALTEFYADKRHAKRGGRTVWCKECMRTYNQGHWERNKEWRRIQVKEYQAQNPEVGRAIFVRRKVRMKGNEVVPYNREDIIIRDEGICYLCGLEVVDLGDIDIDHVIPIYLGGPDVETNVKVTHHLCNLRKGKRLF